MDEISRYKAIKNYDPTNTTSLRNAFSAQMRSRFNSLANLVKKAVAIEDCFGLKDEKTKLNVMSSSSLTPGYRAYEFLTTPEKIVSFLEWLKERESKGVLEITRMKQLGDALDEHWTDMYVDSAYRQGISKARQQLGALPSLVGKIPEDTTGFLPKIHMDRIGMLYLRVFTDLQGITAAMDILISRVLSQGMAEGRNPREIARMLEKVITGAGDLSLTDTLGRFIPARRRAEILARTEIIRAHHMATIQEYRNYDIVNVKVKAEWATAGDDRVCDRCAELEGRIFTLDEIEFMIPLHPQCRCLALPVDMDQKV